MINEYIPAGYANWKQYNEAISSKKNHQIQIQKIIAVAQGAVFAILGVAGLYAALYVAAIADAIAK